MKPYFIILLLFVLGCQAMPESDLIIQNVHIVDVSTGELIENQTVTIQDGQISRIESTGQQLIGDGVIDGTGRYLIPGLWDMHVHFRGGEELIDENKDLLPLYIANGVTTVRDAGGDLTPSVFEWIHQIEVGELTGPTIFTSGPKLDGPNARWEGSIPISSIEDIPAAIDSLENLGVDYVKIYDSTLDPDLFLPIIDEAANRGLPVTGHMPFDVVFSESVEHGLSATEHIFFAFKGQSSEELSITNEIKERRGTNNPLGFLEALLRLSDTQDSDTAAELHRLMAEMESGIIPTLHISDVLANLKQRDHSRDEYRSYIGPGILETYQGRYRSALRAPDDSPNIYAMPAYAASVTDMMRNGVPVYAGSDAGPYNTFVYPGLSLHKELEELVKAGFTPVEALRTATINPAAFFDKEDEVGQIKKGFSADLVLLNKNPLENITHTQDIHSVITKGKTVYSEEHLKNILEELKNKYGQQNH